MGRTMRKRRRRVLSDHNQSKIETELLKWMTACGWRPEHIKLHKFTVNGSFQLRGLAAVQPVLPNQILIDVPQQLVITRDVALKHLSKHPKTSHLPSHAILALFLLSERAKGEASFWHPYLTSLPASYEMPCFSTPSESECFPPYLQRVDRKQRDTLRRKFLLCRAAVEVEGGLNYNAFRWAWFTVNSRGVYSPDGSDNLALVPFLDMFNHSPDVRVEAETMPDGNYRLTNLNRTYRKGDQVMINYGPHSNLSLYSEYGFILGDNADDYFPLELRDLTQASSHILRQHLDVFVRSAALIEQHGLCRSLSVSREGMLSWNTGACFYILSQWDNSDGHEVIAAAYQCGDFLEKNHLNSSNSIVKSMGLTLISEKMNQVRESIRSIVNRSQMKSASLRTSLDMLRLHQEILEQAAKLLCSN